MPGVYRPPSSPFLGGRQPLAPRRRTPVDEPPLGTPGRRLQAALVSSWWRPGQAPLPFRRLLVQGIDDPPFGQRLPWGVLLGWWQGDPIGPHPLRPGVPGEPAEVADDPPFGGRTAQWVILGTWQPIPGQSAPPPKAVPAAADDFPWPTLHNPARDWYISRRRRLSA